MVLNAPLVAAWNFCTSLTALAGMMIPPLLTALPGVNPPAIALWNDLVNEVAASFPASAASFAIREKSNCARILNGLFAFRFLPMDFSLAMSSLIPRRSPSYFARRVMLLTCVLMRRNVASYRAHGKPGVKPLDQEKRRGWCAYGEGAR